MERTIGLQLDPRLGEPLYRQIFDQVVSRIRTGALPPGVRLPASRDLAKQLKTHRNTVVRAFDELSAAGFVTSTVGRGTFVAERPLAPAARQPPAGGLPWGSLLSSFARSEALGRPERYRRSVPGTDFVHLSRMQASNDLLPYDLLRRCIDHVLRTLGARALGYSPPGGLPRLRECIALELTRSGVPARPDDLLVTTGSQQGLDLVARALCEPGDAFGVDAYTYYGALGAFGAAGARVMPVRADDEGPALLELRRFPPRALKGLYLMPNCSNPTGSLISHRRRNELVAWSRASCVPLVEDDYGAELDLDGVPTPPALRALDGDVLYLGTYSKRLIPALRIGYLLCPGRLVEPLTALKGAMDLGCSTLMQHALAEFLERRYLERHVEGLVVEYRQRRDTLAEALTEALPSDVRWTLPARGVTLWLRLPPDVPSALLFDEAVRCGVLVAPSDLYRPDQASRPELGEDGVRLTFCAESPERLALGARRLGKAVRAVRRRSGRHRRSTTARVDAV